LGTAGLKGTRSKAFERRGGLMFRCATARHEETSRRNHFMAKMTRAEREDCARNLAVCRSAVSTFEKMLAEDDEADKAAKAASDSETVASIAKRDGTAAGILAARSMGRKGGPQN
jgi:hypothetical protein